MKRLLIVFSMLLALSMGFIAPFTTSARADTMHGTFVQYYVHPYGYRGRRYHHRYHHRRYVRRGGITVVLGAHTVKH